MKDIPERKRLRLEKYDYSTDGAYFITICTQDREEVFGKIGNGVMQKNDAGEMVHTWWCKLSEKFPVCGLDEFVVMPNHIHGVLWIDTVGVNPRVHPLNTGQTRGSVPTKIKISQIIQWFKTMTTNEYIRHVKNNNWPEFNGKLWQRSFYDRIVRNDDELGRIRAYIIQNPENWKQDKNYGSRLEQRVIFKNL